MDDMEGKITISKVEVRKMVETWVSQNALTPEDFRVIEIKSPSSYGFFDPVLEIEFSNEREEEERRDE